MCSELDLTKPMEMRDGDSAEVLYVADTTDGERLLVRVTALSGRTYVLTLPRSGKSYGDPRHDLVNVPTTPAYHARTLFIAAKGTRIEPHLHNSADEAKRAFPTATAIIEIDLGWSDGEGIEKDK